MVWFFTITLLFLQEDGTGMLPGLLLLTKLVVFMVLILKGSETEAAHVGAQLLFCLV